jgi:FtsP/CotA-like multicopper oxidase with cupredoxin domain
MEAMAMNPDSSRREFLVEGGLAAGLLAVGDGQVRAGQAAGHQHGPGGQPPQDHRGHPGPVGGPSDRGKLVAGRRTASEPPVPVEAPDVPRLSWTMNGGVKEFHLYARHMRREFLPDQWFDVWSFNDSMPGPTIEAVEGDRVRIFVHNELPESTGIHWHGLEVPAAMDGVPGLTQDPIRPGETFAYEFDLHQNGTFFYHTHGAMQEALGMVGLFIIHPKEAYSPPVDRDFGLILQEWAILPGSSVTNTMSMEFNLFTVNGRSAPYITPLVVRLGDRVRIRLVNFSVIDHHPMHLHGLTFWVTGTEAGRMPDSAWYPGNNVLVAVAQSRDVEFVANNPGDWVLHCHMFHHMMNFMSSMVGPMGGHTRTGPQAGGSMATGMGMITRGPALSGEFGAQFGRGTGEQTGAERAVGTGPGMGGSAMGSAGRRMGSGPEHGQHGGDRPKVPGFPQDMFEMINYSEAELKKLNKPETRGMRKDWYRGVEGLMTVVRVLPPDLYDKVVSGKGDVLPGASIPGAGPGRKHEGHEHQH